MLKSLKQELYIFKEKKRMVVWREVLWLYTFLFMVWGAYRLFFRMPVWFEEVFIKALVFGLPVVYLAKKNKWSVRDLGIKGDKFFQSVYLGLGLGVILGFAGQIGNIIRHGTLVFENYGLNSETIGTFMILALVTAFWEGLVFMGYLLQRLDKVVKSEQVLVVVVGLMFAMIHAPALLVQGMASGQMMVSLLLLLLLGVGSSILMLRQRNLIAPVMAQAMWGVTVFMFR